jgi:hypothetical protein
MTPKEQKDLIMGYRKYLFLETDKNSEEIIDAYLATLIPTSERYKATMAFFDKLPDGLREMAKENYEEGYGEKNTPIDLFDSLWNGFTWSSSKEGYKFWKAIYQSIINESPSLTLNGVTYDLTKCYEN